MLKIDLHLHTADDPVDRLPHSSEALIDRAAVLGFQALAITLHERQLSDQRLTSYARERGILLLPGTERTIEGRHVLCLNFPAAVERVRSFDELARLKARTHGLVIAPHPFFPGSVCVGRAVDRHAGLFDAIEYSYFYTRVIDFNRAAEQWARQRGKPLVGNSDLHDLRQLGRTFSLVDAEPRADAVCEAIRAGRVRLVTSPVPLPELAAVLAGMAACKLLPRPRVRPHSSDRSPGGRARGTDERTPAHA